MQNSKSHNKKINGIYICKILYITKIITHEKSYIGHNKQHKTQKSNNNPNKKNGNTQNTQNQNYQTNITKHIAKKYTA